MTMLTDTQRAALSSALEGAETGDGDATQKLFRALSDVLPFTTLNVLTAARWLLRTDDAHRAQVATAEVRAWNAALEAAVKAYFDDDGEADTDLLIMSLGKNDPTIAALRQELTSE